MTFVEIVHGIFIILLIAFLVVAIGLNYGTRK